MSFLKAEWRKLIMANYIISPEILKKYVPFGTELDLWNNNCYVSLVGFMFQNTQVLGVKVPFHINFEEVNLRFYVKRFDGTIWKRGVVFIKEIVPKSAITFVANTLYKENYETQKMKHSWEINNEVKAVYEWISRKSWNKIQVVAEPILSELEINGEAEFITEHYWGYSKINDTKTTEYEVKHPRWKKYAVRDYEIEVDFEKNYGKDFSILNEMDPSSVYFVEGSEISVENKKIISKTNKEE